MTEKQRFHSSDCANAENQRCRCWCQGKFHGINKTLKKVQEIVKEIPA